MKIRVNYIGMIFNSLFETVLSGSGLFFTAKKTKYSAKR